MQFNGSGIIKQKGINGIEVIPDSLHNDFGSAIGFPPFSNPGFGGFGGIGPNGPLGIGGQQISELNTIFKNLRWYLVSNFRQPLSQAYAEIGLINKVVCVPVDDALRGGVTIETAQLEEEEITEIQIEMDRDQDLMIAHEAACWNRLYGGAGIITLTDQDPMDQFRIEDLSPDSPLEFRAADLWELFWNQQDTFGYDPSTQEEDYPFYNYYGEDLHKSHVMKLKGMVAPSFLKPRLRGWGLSVVEMLVRSINQYLKATDLSFEVLDEFKVDYYKIKNLTSSLSSPQSEAAIRKRIRMANWQKNYQNAVVMDSEDDHMAKQLSFAGIAETMAEIRIQVASEMRMTTLKLFGTPAQGLNASDEESLQVYNDMVESEVRNKLKYDILRMIEIRCQRKFGFVPSDLKIEFQPLKQMSAIEQEDVKDRKFNRLIQAQGVGLISADQFVEAANRGKLFDVKIDSPSVSAMPDSAEEDSQYLDCGTDTDDPGASRAATRKVKASERFGKDKQ